MTCDVHLFVVVFVMFSIPFTFISSNMLSFERNLECCFHDGIPIDMIRKVSKETQNFFKRFFEQNWLHLLQEGQHDTINSLESLHQEAIPNPCYQVKVKTGRILSQEPLCCIHGDVDILLVQVFRKFGEKVVNKLLCNVQDFVRFRHALSKQPSETTGALIHNGCNGNGENRKKISKSKQNNTVMS